MSKAASDKKSPYNELYQHFGRPRKFKSPEDLVDAANAYFKWAEDNPIARTTTIDKDGEHISYVKRPFSFETFCAHAGIFSWRDFKKTYDKVDDFHSVILAIEDIIRGQQIDGATAGAYNANIVARLNGLSDSVKQEVEAKVSSRLSREEVSKILGGDDQ